MAFCVACRLSGSNRPPHASHEAIARVRAPQYGQIVGLGSGEG
jgi:hypothetical protein